MKTALLKQAIAEHQRNPDLHAALRSETFADDGSQGLGGSLRDMSIPALGRELAAANVPMLVWAGWMDACTAQRALQR
jgi:hypothetical protein